MWNFSNTVKKCQCHSIFWKFWFSCAKKNNKKLMVVKNSKYGSLLDHIAWKGTSFITKCINKGLIKTHLFPSVHMMWSNRGTDVLSVLCLSRIKSDRLSRRADATMSPQASASRNSSKDRYLDYYIRWSTYHQPMCEIRKMVLIYIEIICTLEYQIGSLHDI